MRPRATASCRTSSRSTAPYKGEIPTRNNGVLVAMEGGISTAYALDTIQERGRLFIGPQEEIYEGMIIGENARPDDMPVNPCRAKKLTNMRSQGDGKGISLAPPLKMTPRARARIHRARRIRGSDAEEPAPAQEDPRRQRPQTGEPEGHKLECAHEHDFHKSVLVFRAPGAQASEHMKTFSLFFASLTLAVCLARADVIIEQKVESSVMSGPTTTKIKGDMLRVDSDMPGMGKVTTILDLTKGKSTMLMHSSKMAMQMDLNALKKKAQAVSTGTEKPKPTGQKEKVGDWNTEVYEMKTGEMPVKLWLTKDLPNSAALKEQMNKLTKAAAMGVDPGAI